jgi:F-type H+-transporting ATPase subunit epsilon
MTGALHLTIVTPTAILVDRDDVKALRAEDKSGSFGVLPGHTDLLTVLPASVVRWRGADDLAHYCALRGGVLRVTKGDAVAIVCRQGAVGDDLARLEAEVEELRAAEADSDRRARVEQLRLHAHVVRQLMRFLRPGGPAAGRPMDAKKDAVP